MLYALKVLLAATIIVVVTEISKTRTSVGALLLSLPTVSIVSLVWLYAETRDAERVAKLAGQTFWLVLPSLVLFVALPALLRAGMGFGPALALSMSGTAAAYGLMLWAARTVGASIG